MMHQHTKTQTEAADVATDLAAPKATNVTPIAPNVIQSTPNATTTGNECTEECSAFVCNQCGRDFPKSYNLKRHTGRCKGVSNPLECYKCHAVFKHASGKCRHLKTCTGTANVVEKVPDQQVVQNITNNTTNYNIVNNVVIQLVAFQPNGSRKQTEFTIDHIPNEQFLTLFKGKNETSAITSSLGEITSRILEAPQNQLVKKTNMRSGDSLVHMGDNRWTVQQDKNVYPKLTEDITNVVLEQLEVNGNNQKAKVAYETLGKIVSDENPYKKDAVAEVKLRVYEATKSSVLPSAIVSEAAAIAES